MVFGGASDENDLFIYPTIMHNVTEEDLVMQEEIFGPLLPIIDVQNVDDAIKFVNKRYDTFENKNNEHCAKKSIYEVFFWFVFSRIWTQYGDLFSPNAGKCGPE